MLLMNLIQGETLKIFPYTAPNGSVNWFAPTGKLPHSMPAAQQQYIRSILSLAGQLAVQNKVSTLNELISKLQKYQYRYGSTTIPAGIAISAEHIYNSFPFATVLFIVNLTLGLLSVFFLTRPRRYALFTWLMAVSWCVLHLYTGAAVDNKRNNTHCQWLRNYASSVVAHYDCVNSNHTQTPNYDYFRTACQWFYAVG